MGECVHPLIVEFQLYPMLRRARIAGPTQLGARLEQIGVYVSVPQLCRLINNQPSRVSLPLLGGFCTVLDCAPADLLTICQDPLWRPPSPRLTRYFAPPRVC